jgi:LuxR family maltose regulon positive regulatory protein
LQQKWGRNPTKARVFGSIKSNDNTQEGLPLDLMLLIDSSDDVIGAKLEIITEKIAQPAPLPRVSRPRLIEMLEKSLAAGTSTIISGRAGAGKTALAVDFAHQCGRPVAWYKVDAPDADPRIFFEYLISSIRDQQPAFGGLSLTQLVKSVEINRMRWLADAFVYELAEGETAAPLLIVIEDLHLVFDSEWLVPFFSRLLPLLPSDVHVLITSRSLPPAPLWRMRSKQFLVVIDDATLAFTRAEAASLFESYGLSSEQANIALDHTHGRAVALDGFAAYLQQSGGLAAGSSGG